MNTQPTPIETMSFEAALAELESIVRSLEAGNTPLKDSIAAYERGMTLKKHCETTLQDARLRVEKITLSAEGAPQGTTPFNPEQ